MQHVHIAKWGNSLGFRIPHAIAMGMRIKAGDALELSARKDGLLLKKVVHTRKHYILADILNSFSSAAEHPEVDFGPPKGDEVW